MGFTSPIHSSSGDVDVRWLVIFTLRAANLLGQNMTNRLFLRILCAVHFDNLLPSPQKLRSLFDSLRDQVFVKTNLNGDVRRERKAFLVLQEECIDQSFMPFDKGFTV